MKKKGFTIVELLIYMGLLSILIAVVTEIFLSILDLQSQSTAVSSVAQDGKYVLSKLSYDIRNATTISTPSTLGQSSPTLQLTIDGDSNSYSGTSGDLVVTNASGSDNLTSYGSQISNLSFRRLGTSGGKNSLAISFTLTSRQALKSGYEVRDYQTTIGLR